jgi:hypothetical protein
MKEGNVEITGFRSCATIDAPEGICARVIVTNKIDSREEIELDTKS